MKYPIGTPILVKCDDNTWWPARVEKRGGADQEDGGDCYVSFYHSPGDLHLIDSSDNECVKPLLHGDAIHSALPYSVALSDSLVERVVTETCTQQTYSTEASSALGSRSLRQKRTAPHDFTEERDKRARLEEPPVVTSEAVEASPSDSEEDGKFVPAVGEAALAVVRSEVFENDDSFVLSPKYRFVELLGGVPVDNVSLHTVFPLTSISETGLGDERRRVLLVPLSPEYRCKGWLTPFTVDDQRVSMEVEVNGHTFPMRENWSIPAGKENETVRTAPTLDITHAALSSVSKTLRVAVRITPLEDADLWSGVVAAIVADEVTAGELSDTLYNHYRKKGNVSLNPSDTLIDLSECSVKILCPLSSTIMKIPARSQFCEHLQCMDLKSVLEHCFRSNTWNCPMCNARMKPDDILINYRLKEWMEDNKTIIGQVDYVVETPNGRPLRAILTKTEERDVVLVDEE